MKREKILKNEKKILPFAKERGYEVENTWMVRLVGGVKKRSGGGNPKPKGNFIAQQLATQ